MSAKSEKPPISVIWDGRVFRPADPDSREMSDMHSDDARLNVAFSTTLQVTWSREYGHYTPADMRSAEVADMTFVQGAYLDGRFTRPKGAEDRRAGNLRLWWAGIGLLLENTDDERWPTKRKLHNLILEELGFVEKIWRIDGSYRLVVDSIAIDKMEDEDFDRLFEKARAFCHEHFGFDPWETWVAERNAAKANQGYRR